MTYFCKIYPPQYNPADLDYDLGRVEKFTYYDEDGEPGALVEYPDGQLEIVDLDSIELITFSRLCEEIERISISKYEANNKEIRKIYKMKNKKDKRDKKDEDCK